MGIPGTSGLTGRLRLLLAFAMAATTVVVVAPFSPTAVALDALQFTSVKGVWDQSTGAVQAAESTNAPDCLTFGKDVSSSDGSFSSGQNTNAAEPTVRNQVRFGHPSNVDNNQCGNVNDRSGFGFAGVSLPSISGLFEVGRFTHFNRPIQSDADNAGSAILDATFRFQNQTTNPATNESLTVEYEVDLDETPNGANPCKYVTGGSNVPAGVTVDNSNGCADRIQISVANQNVTRTIGQTDITFEIGGFGTLSNGSCGTPTGNGNILFTREGGERQACVFGQPARGTLIINKSVQGGGSGSYPFTYQEISQKYASAGSAIGTATTQNVQVQSGTGTSGPISLAPGLYNLTEVVGQLGTDVDFASVSCATNGNTATLPSYHGNTTAGANVIVDLDSNETITCTYTNRKAAKITIVKDAQPNSMSADFAFTTTSNPTVDTAKFAPLPTTFTLDDDNDATYSNTLTRYVDAGTYTITEGTTPNWRLGGTPTCSFTTQTQGSTASGNLATRTATLNLQPGADVTCTFVNTEIPPPDVAVTKTRNPGSFSETDGTVTYGVRIDNNGTERFRITSLRDLISLNGTPGTTDADLADADPISPTNVGGDFTANSCDELVAANGWIAAGGFVTCSFTIAYTDRDFPQQIDDTVTVTVQDDGGRTDSDQSTVDVKVTDALPVVVVDKKAVVENVVVAPGGPLTYDVTVSNGVKVDDNVIVAASEPVEITAVTDQMSVDAAGSPEVFAAFGPALDITTAASPITSTNCNTLVGTWLDPYESVTCRFVVDTSTPGFGTVFAGDVLRNTVTVSVKDDDGNSANDSDDADRDVVADAPEFEVYKTDGGAQVVEPGTGPEGQVTYTFLIDNVGQVGVNEPLTITGFRDVVSFEGTEIGTIQFPGGANTFSRAGVSLISETCSGIVGTTLYPATGTYQMPGIGSDSDYTRSTPAAGQANAAGTSCTVTLQLPGNAGEEYSDDVFVSAVSGVGTGGTPLPDATDDATTPIVERPPSITITKTPDTSSVPETGGEVTFTFVIKNTSGTTDPLTITGLSDIPFGDLLAEDRADTDCDTLLVVGRDPFVGATIQPGGTISCELTVDLAGDAGDQHRDDVTVNAVDDEGVPASATDFALVDFTDALPDISVLKTAVAVDGTTLTPPGNASVSEFGGDVTFEVVVTNETLEAVILTALVDEIGGIETDLYDNGAGPCDITGVVLGPKGQAGDSFTCQFTITIVQTDGADDHTNTVTATGMDDEGNPTSDHDDEVVIFDTTPPVVSIDKDDRQATVDEPGGDPDGIVTYYLTITNGPDAKEAITSIVSLKDTIVYAKPAQTLTVDLLEAADGTLMTRNTCPGAIALALPLAPGGTIPCEFDIVLTGTAQFVEDTVTVVAADDDGEQSPPAFDDEVTPIVDVPIDFTITKTADTGNTDPLMVVDGQTTVEYTFEVENLSAIEPLYVVSLDDDKFGDLSAACGWTIATPLVVAPSGTASCVLDRPVTMPANGVHTNEATAEGGDDEIYDAITDDDPDTTGQWIERSDTAEVYQEATITVIKQATPASRSFDFLLDGSDRLTAEATNGTYAPVEWTELDEGRYLVTEDRPLDWDLTNVSCTVNGVAAGDDAESILNGVALTLGHGDDAVCTFANVLQGEVGVSKTLTSGPTQQAGTNKYDLTYTVTITNDSYSAETFQVFDDLEFPAGAVTIGTISSSLGDTAFDGAWNGAGELTNGVQSIAGRTIDGPTVETITVPVTVTLPGASALGGSCLPDDDTVRKVINSVSFTDDQNEPDDSVCTELPDPAITPTKTVNDESTTFVDGVWTVVYDITVTNTGDGPGVYTVEDTLDFGDDVEVTGATATLVEVTGQTDPAIATGSGVINPSFDPDPTSAGYDSALTDGAVEIVAGAVHTYQVTVTATVTDPEPGAGVCSPDEGEAGGFLNTATVSLNGEDLPPVSDCEPYNTLTLVKNLFENDGGEAGYDAFPLTATPSAGGSAVVSGTQQVTGAVPAGDYDLAEPAVAGYASSGWTCVVGTDELEVTDGTDTAGSISIALADGDGVDVVCEITNDDEPVDLQLTKTDGDLVAAVAGGPAFPYTITVGNVGDRAVDASEVYVTVVDVLPDGFEWVSFPDNALEFPRCAVDGADPSVLRCDLLPSSLGVGQQVVLETMVQALPDTPGGTYTNVAWVTIDDDPVCDTEAPGCDPTCEVSCTPPPCPEGEVPGSNVGCDDTPLVHEGALEIVKVDDVLTVKNGETFSYDISVSNTGPSPITDVVVTDDLPDGLTLVSVSANAAHWTCNDVDPISCSYNTALAAGPAASSITVTVSVDLDAVFDDDLIVNTAVANGDLDDKPLPPVDDDEETPLERSLDVDLLTADCAKDAPYINYDVRALGFVPTGPITFRLYDSNDNLVQTVVQSSLAGRFLYPGAAVDADGNGTDWPGWKLDGGVWVLDDSDAILRDGLRVEVEVNPTATTSVEYPPASAACASPEQTSADLAIDKVASVTTVAVGDGSGPELFDWVLEVVNEGPDPAVGVVVNDIIPSSLTITGVSSSYFTCSTSGQTVNCTRDTMPVGASGTITVSVSLPDSAAAGAIENVANVTSNVPDPNLDNNSDDAVVDVVAQQPPVTQAPPPVTLPPTGSNGTSPMLKIGLLLLAIGAVGVLGARRRRGVTVG
ncbi:MAG: DUF11 domain-containing protein [Ilumatobacter sp.]|nr:DUF11 domain-containing protein [Ilumatobacter sp.]